MAAQSLPTNTHEFSIHLGATRVIYHEKSQGADIQVSNPQDYPVLIQSVTKNEDKKTDAPFIVTPPLFRLEAKQQSRLRIVRTGGDLAQDRETLQWVCVKALPPVLDEDKKQVNTASLEINLSINTCDKLIYRPESVKGKPETVAGSLIWARTDEGVKVTNPTGFYMNIKSLVIDGKEVRYPEYVSPFSSRTYKVASAAHGPVQWKIVTDNGGDSRMFQSEIK